jgi:hypothetical protein
MKELIETDTTTMLKMFKLIQLIEKEISESDKSIPIKNVKALLKVVKKFYKAKDIKGTE